jgi:signal peptidase II
LIKFLIYIKTNFILGEEVEKYSNGSKFCSENGRNGRGVQIPGAYGKIFFALLELQPLVELDIGCGFGEKKSSDYLIVYDFFNSCWRFRNIVILFFYG